MKIRRVPDAIIVRDIILSSDRFYRPTKRKVGVKKHKVENVKCSPRPLVQQKSFLWMSPEKPKNEVTVLLKSPSKCSSITRSQHSPIAKKTSGLKKNIWKNLIQTRLLSRSSNLSGSCELSNFGAVIPLGSPPGSGEVITLSHLYLVEQFQKTVDTCENFLHFERISCDSCVASQCFLLSPLSPRSPDLDSVSQYSNWSTGTENSSVSSTPVLAKVCASAMSRECTALLPVTLDIALILCSPLGLLTNNYGR